MEYDIERRRRNNLRKKRRRERQIRRRVCFAGLICILSGVAVMIAGKTSQTAAVDEPYAPEGMGETTDTASHIQKSGTSLKIEDAEGPAAIVPRGPVFVCLPVPMSEEEQRIIFDICTDNNAAFSLVMAIIAQESGFEREARSATGDSGYMQINDCNLEKMAECGFVDMYDTAQNIGAGVYILRELFDTYGDGEVHRVLMAYNMGTNTAEKLWAQGIETSEYSREVAEREAEYSRYMDEHLKGY